MAVFLDSSAIVKLVVREPESAALRRFLRTHAERVSCALARGSAEGVMAGFSTKASRLTLISRL
jgi:predicted nucleic acid-binding protein